jgi:Mn-dependent DtxR family transcriptional regulator
MNTLEKIQSVLPTGKENAIHQTQLANMLGVQTSTAKKMIQNARRQGAQIMSSKCGYWLAETDAEMQEYVDRMHREAISRLATIKPIKHTLNEVKGQMSLSDAFTGADCGGVVNGQR